MKYLSLAATVATFGNAIIQFIEKDLGAGFGLVAGGMAFLSIAMRNFRETTNNIIRK